MNLLVHDHGRRQRGAGEAVNIRHLVFKLIVNLTLPRVVMNKQTWNLLNYWFSKTASFDHSNFCRNLFNNRFEYYYIRILKLGVCACCAQITQIAQFALRIKAYFFTVAQFALRIYKAICVFAICALKK